MSTTAMPRRTVNPRALAVFAGVVILLPHVPAFFHRLLDGDEAVYGSIASLMNLGGRLYAEGGVDNKPPGIFWVYAAVFRIFGVYQMTAVHTVAVLVILATCALIFLAGRQLASVRAGVLAAVFYGVMTGAGNPRLLAANTEVFMMLPLAASFLLTLRRRWWWSGLLLVTAGAFRQSAAIQLLLVPMAVVYLEAAETRARAAALFAAGIAVGLVAGAGLLALTGSLPGFWRWTIGILAQYAGTNYTLAVVWQRAQDSVLPFALASAVLWAAAIAWTVRWRRLERGHRLVVAWVVVSGIGSLAGGHLSWHYFIQVMGPLALLSALAIAHVLDTRYQKQVAAVVAVGVVVPALAWGAYDISADPLTYDWSPPIAQHELVAAYIRDHTTPKDRVFVWGDWPALYVESDRIMSSRFPGFLRGFDRTSGLPPNNWDTTADVWPELQADLERNPPALIVDTAAAGWSDFGMYPMRNFPVVQSFVASKYHLVATVDRVAIYARNS
jgi:4-amino-4-deoxy-L-arabinose transferase-like glycosyltransferase